MVPADMGVRGLEGTDIVCVCVCVSVCLWEEGAQGKERGGCAFWLSLLEVAFVVLFVLVSFGWCVLSFMCGATTTRKRCAGHSRTALLAYVTLGRWRSSQPQRTRIHGH